MDIKQESRENGELSIYFVQNLLHLLTQTHDSIVQYCLEVKQFLYCLKKKNPNSMKS